MEKIIKGQIANIDSWIERIAFSKKVSQDAIFTGNYADYKFKLYFWNSTDAQPCFLIMNTDANSPDNNAWPNELVVKSDDGTEITLHNVEEITADVVPFINDGTLKKVTEQTKGYFNIDRA